MVDYLQQDLNIGDCVTTIDPRYKLLRLGKVVGFTDKQVRIKLTSCDKPILRYPFVVAKM